MARTIVVGCVSIVVASRSIRAAGNLFRIADAIAIAVYTRATADAAGIQHVAFAITCTLCNAIASADAAFIEDVAVAIASPSGDAIATAYAAGVEDIAVAIASPSGDAIASANSAGVKLLARTVIFRGVGIVVTSRRIRATGNRIFARSVIVICIGIIVGCQRIRATTCISTSGCSTLRSIYTYPVEVERELLLCRSHAIGEYLSVECTAGYTRAGDLHEQSPLGGGIRQTIGRAIQYVPSAARVVVDQYVLAAQRRGRIEHSQPRLGAALHRAHRYLAARRSVLNSDGHPAVKSHLGNQRQEHRVDSVCRRTRRKRVVVESSGRVNGQRELIISKNGAQEIRWRQHIDVETVGCRAGNTFRRMRFHSHRVGRYRWPTSTARAEVARAIVVRG